MASLIDEQGHNQGFKPCKALEIRTKRRAEYISDIITGGENIKVLEIGCGVGDLANYISQNNNCSITAIDKSESFIDLAKSKYKIDSINFMCIDFFKLSEQDEEYDYIIGNGILHHLYNKMDEALNIIKKLLRPQGKIIFLEPNIYNPYCAMIFNHHFFREMAHLDPEEMAFSKRYISKKLMKAGFHEIKIEYRDFLLPNTPTAFINLTCFIGRIVEKIPLLKMSAQSIFISASKDN